VERVGLYMNGLDEGGRADVLGCWELGACISAGIAIFFILVYIWSVVCIYGIKSNCPVFIVSSVGHLEWGIAMDIGPCFTIRTV